MYQKSIFINKQHVIKIFKIEVIKMTNIKKMTNFI
jgi:hypothetical protein